MRHALAAVVFVLPLAALAFAMPPTRCTPACRMCLQSPRPRAVSEPGLRPRPEQARLVYGRAESDVECLRSDVRRLERLVVDLCGALVYSDDVALLERTAAALGPIYRDASFSSTRHPMYARQAVERVLATRGLVAAPPVRVWRPTSGRAPM